MSVDLESVMEMLENSFGENVDEIYIPSLQKSLPFKPMTVGMQKSISKMSMNYEIDVDYHMLKLTILKTLCLDNSFDETLITEIDFIAMLAQLRLNNFTEKLQLTTICNNCKQKFTHTIDLEKIVENCKKYEFKTCEIIKHIDFKGENVEFKFILNESTVLDNINYVQYINFLREDSDNVVDLDNARIFTYPIKFIKDVIIDGQQLTIKKEEQIVGFNKFDIIEKFRFIDTLPPKLYSEGDNNILMKVLEMYPHKRLFELYDNAICPHCNQVKEGVVTNDSFFLI